MVGGELGGVEEVESEDRSLPASQAASYVCNFDKSSMRQ